MKQNKHLWVMMVLFLGLSFMVVRGLDYYQDQVSETTMRDLEVTISRYALQCYATEGAYPPDLQYLVDHYGLVLNTDKYIYDYQAVAENIRPSIKVMLQFKSRRSHD